MVLTQRRVEDLCCSADALLATGNEKLRNKCHRAGFAQTNTAEPRADVDVAKLAIEEPQLMRSQNVRGNLNGTALAVDCEATCNDLVAQNFKAVPYLQCSRLCLDQQKK
ncbi:Protein of unknown function [Gryllus bimaculatus]|nr:Protein of unknown function [Gryllus bimaculatus]